MKATVLGCGGSLGVPLIGNRWGACDPTHPRNRRRRPSLLVQSEETTILVDTSPDCRNQLLDARVEKISAIIFTHLHADHTHGLDDVRPFTFEPNPTIPAYTDALTRTSLIERFAYAVADVEMDRGFYKPIIALHDMPETLEIGDIKVTSFVQNHGRINSIGLMFGDKLAYSTDSVGFDDRGWSLLQGIDTWIVDATRLRPHSSHAHLDLTLEWIDRVKPRRAFLTHMNHEMDYAALCDQLPDHIRPAYDGLVLDF